MECFQRFFSSPTVDRITKARLVLCAGSGCLRVVAVSWPMDRWLPRLAHPCGKMQTIVEPSTAVAVSTETVTIATRSLTATRVKMTERLVLR